MNIETRARVVNLIYWLTMLLMVAGIAAGIVTEWNECHVPTGPVIPTLSD